MTTLYIAPQYQKTLALNQLNDFDAIWNVKVNWFEEPNQRRGGWSGVGRIELKQADGSMMGAFLKKQDNHQHKSWLHPIRGIPTFEREFIMMRYLEQCGVNAPEVMLFGRNPNGDLKTTLLTKELAGFVPLEDLTSQLFAKKRSALSEQNTILQAVAGYARQLHAAKVQHRSFYPKHLFVNMINANVPQVAAIDLEKSRINLFSVLRSLMDLSALNRHAEHWSKSRRMYFYLHYLGIKHLTPYAKWLCRRIVKRSHRAKRK
ncbi:MAG: lipopolysaccharide kinase InaA family protein [Methylotenera sp.]|nr:lipopolysaccharide kinase InaA family protein [Methylotenera sp.]MDD4925182.1 lipopolysaccharide kinase InaA family protein [Methylotenera sp.]